MTKLSPGALSVLAVPAFKDNYLWLVHDGANAVVVDPGDAAPVLAALATHHLTLTAILLTHHHADHIGGVAALLRHAAVPVFGPAHDGIEGLITRPLAEGDRFTPPGLALPLRVLDLPGHTAGHIAYLSERPGVPWLFSGDTLFAGGCGRLFNGTMGQLQASLDRLLTLPDDTEVYCAHEYTLANLRFAQAVEPGNAALPARIEHESAKRARGVPTVPTTIGVEKATNPFLRYRQPAIVAQLVALGKLEQGARPDQAFAALRLWKNIF